jgi:hypothetical protein
LLISLINEIRPLSLSLSLFSVVRHFVRFVRPLIKLANATCSAPLSLKTSFACFATKALCSALKSLPGSGVIGDYLATSGDRRSRPASKSPSTKTTPSQPTVVV